MYMYACTSRPDVMHSSRVGYMCLDLHSLSLMLPALSLSIPSFLSLLLSERERERQAHRLHAALLPVTCACSWLFNDCWIPVHGFLS